MFSGRVDVRLVGWIMLYNVILCLFRLGWARWGSAVLEMPGYGSLGWVMLCYEQLGQGPVL
jgi:hypothetical protein